MADLTGKIAIVTAGCSGAGSSISEKLALAGAKVIATSRDPETVKDLNIKWSGVENMPEARCLTFEAEAVDSFFKAVISDYGSANILVNAAAGRFAQKPVEATTAQDIIHDVESSVVSSFLCSQTLVNNIEKSHVESIVNIGSIYGSLAVDHRIYDSPEKQSSISYAIGKSALEHMTRYLAAYWAHYGVRVNCVSPGGIKNAQEQSFLDKYNARVPMGRMAEYHEISGPVLFLAGEDSSYITGEIIMVDGGLHTW